MMPSKNQSSKHSRSPSKLSANDPTFLPNQLDKISETLKEVLSLSTPAESLIGKIELLYSHVVVMNSEIIYETPQSVSGNQVNPLSWCSYTWATRKCSPVFKGVAPLVFGPQVIPEFRQPNQKNDIEEPSITHKSEKEMSLSLTDLHRLFGQRPSLSSSDLHLLDPITRNAIRRENILLAKSVGLELSEDLNKSIEEKNVLLKISDKVWLYLFETGLIAENVTIALKYLNEILTGAAALQRQIYGEKTAGDITALFNLLSLTRDTNGPVGKDGEKLDLELINTIEIRLEVQLEIIYHALVMLNDIAFEGLDAEQIRRRKEPPKYVFSNEKLVGHLVKGLVEVLSSDVIKKAFKDEKSTKLVNRILQVLLSLESDKTLTGLHWLDHLPPINLIKEGGPTKSDMTRQANALNKLIKDFCAGKFSALPIDYAGLPNSDSAKASKFKNLNDPKSEESFKMSEILDGLKLFGTSKGGSKTLRAGSSTATRMPTQVNISETTSKERCFWFAVLDFPTYLLWLGMLVFGAASKPVAHKICTAILNLISDYCAHSPVVQGQFFKSKTFEMFQTLNRACNFELLTPLTSIFSSPNFVVVSKSPEFFKGLMDFISKPIESAWAAYDRGSIPSLNIIKPAILSMETLRQILQAISKQPKCRRSRMQLELYIQKILYPKANVILSYFSNQGSQNSSLHKEKHARTLNQILVPSNQHLPTVFDPNLTRLTNRLVPSTSYATVAPAPQPAEPPAAAPYNHHFHAIPHSQDTKRSLSNPTVVVVDSPVPEHFLFAELCLHTLRLLNDGIRFSGGFCFLFNDNDGLSAAQGTSLDSNLRWAHVDYDYLRQVPGGYAFLAEIQCYYAHHHLFNRQLEFTLEPPQAKAQDDNLSQPKMKHNGSTSPNNMSISPEFQRHTSRNPRPDPATNNWTKVLHKHQVHLISYCTDRTTEIRQMLANTELFARDTGVEAATSGSNSTAVKLQYCLRGPLKILHRYLCGVLVRVPPQEYNTIKMDNLITDLKDNFDALIKMLHLDNLPPQTDSLLSEYLDLEHIRDFGGRGSRDDLNERKMSATDRSSTKYNDEQMRLFRKNQLVLLKIVSLIEALFKRKGFELEIMEVRRETEFELNFTETSSLYAGIGVCENLALSSWMKTVLHIHGENGKSQSLQKLKKAQKQKQAPDRLDGETPQESIERDREFEQVFSQNHSEEDLGLTKGIDELYEDDTEEDPEEIKLDEKVLNSPNRSASREPRQDFQPKSPPSKPVVDQAQQFYQQAKKRLLHEKRIALSEKSCFFENVDMGSNVSDQAYWVNLIGWIHFVLNDKLSQLSAPSTDLSLLFFNEDFIALLNMLHNFTKQKKSVRMILSTLIKNESLPKKAGRLSAAPSMKPGDLENLNVKNLTLDQYLYNSVILLQHALKQATLGGNLKLEIEEFFITSKLISSLMENNCEEFKQRLIDFTLGADAPKPPISPRTIEQPTEPAAVNALGMIYDGLVLNPDITELNFCTEDRGDLVWYNITCLTLMAECMSGPFEKAQDSLSMHIQQKSFCLRLLRICNRINRNINSSFFDLQEALMEFLAAIFEGVNKKKNTVKELISQPESSPDRMFKMITQHLQNLWNNSDVVIQTKKIAKSEKTKPMALNFKDPNYFGNLIGNMVSIGKEEVPEVKKEDPGLENLLDYYTVHPNFSTHPSISIARKLYDIMTFAESIGLRKFMKALNEKRQLMQSIDTDDAGSKMLRAIDNLATGKFFGLDTATSRQASNVSQTPSHKGHDADGDLAGRGVSGSSESSRPDQNLNTMYFKFLMEITGSVEVIVGNKNVCVQFPILPECKFITEEEVEHFMRKCSLEDPNTRLFELIDFVDEVLIDKQNDMKFYKIFPPLIYLTRRRTFKLMVLVIWMLSAAINVIWIISSDIIDTAPQDEIFERIDTISIQAQSAQLGIAILSAIIVLCSLLIFVIWLSTRWINLVNIRELQLKKQKALNSKFTERILKFKAYVIDSLVGQPLPMVLLLHILFVVLYYTVTDFFVCLHLLLFVYHSETTRYIMKSVTKDLRKIGITFLMIVFMVYCYSTIIGYHYADQFKFEFEGVNPCETWLSCLVYTFDYGLRLGGGVGDAMNLLPRDNNYFTEKLIINLTFLLLIKLIASNIVLGIIIDTFSELRTTQSNRGRMFVTSRSPPRE